MDRTIIVVFTTLTILGFVSCRAKTHEHTITVKFDYDFRLTPACDTKVTKICVQQFNLYDISFGAGKRKRLASFPVTAGSKGQERGITFKTSLMPLESRQYRLAVTAQMPNGQESDVRGCTTTVQAP